MSRVIVLAFCLVVCASAAEGNEPGRRPRQSADRLPPGTLVQVERTDGQILTGHLEVASNETTVLLRSELPGIVLRTAIPRSHIRRIRRYRPAPGFEVQRPRAERPGFPRGRFDAVHRQSFDGRVQSLEVRAWPANWDEDAALDGLQLQVVPLNAAGEVVPVAGSLNVQLVARGFNNYRERDTVKPVERWSRKLETREFTRDGAVVNLEFDRIDPEKDLNLIPVGLLNVELGVSGQKVFRASQAEVWFRPPSYIRDELQLHTGDRRLESRDLPRRFPGR